MNIIIIFHNGVERLEKDTHNVYVDSDFLVFVDCDAETQYVDMAKIDHVNIERFA